MKEEPDVHDVLAQRHIRGKVMSKLEKYILVYACNKCGEQKWMDSPRKKFPMPPPVGFVDHKQQEHPGTGPIDHFWHCGVFQPFAMYKLFQVRR